MVIAESLLSRGLQPWLESLRKPRFYLPLWIWIVVGGLTYLLQGIIVYRLLKLPRNALDMIALAVLAILMAANVAYNLVLARTRSPRLLYIGVIWFLPPLVALQVLLVWVDWLAAILNLIYVIWVIGYDLPIMRTLWKMNDPSSHPSAIDSQ
jgi:tryptophan-rich sensory protein